MPDALCNFGSSPRVRGTGLNACHLSAASRFIPACAGNGPAGRSLYGPSPVHPRVCGERIVSQAQEQPTPGSSPRVRGTARTAARTPQRSRFIPACAGNGRCSRSIPSPDSVHPRVCGERNLRKASGWEDSGSSPRVRGTERLGAERDAPARFIPACAGNGPQSRQVEVRLTVHPRVCGERRLPRSFSMCIAGSSPRVRGTAGVERLVGPTDRFIPACAGNGHAVSLSPPPSPVHPRVCGERFYGREHPGPLIGSSPRVRGTARARARRSSPKRFIPACAGNGRLRAGASGRGPVHPRVCGERSDFSDDYVLGVGSSPRVRGTVHLRRCLLPEFRFIPACAGNGPRRPRTGRRPPVHPRVCGERLWIDHQRTILPGSSPRVRGTEPRPRLRGASCRFIPACAGNGGRRAGGVRPGSVHPRVCGERTEAICPAHMAAGSSPRVRGTVVRSAIAGPFVRFIPACAGNGAEFSLRLNVTAVHPRVCGERVRSSRGLRRLHGSSPRVRGTARVRALSELTRRFIPACAGNGPRRAE